MTYHGMVRPVAVALFAAALSLVPAQALASARNSMMLLPEELHYGAASLARYPSQLAQHREEVFALGLQGPAGLPPTAGANARLGGTSLALLATRPSWSSLLSSSDRVYGGAFARRLGPWSLGLSALANQEDSDSGDDLGSGGGPVVDRDGFSREWLELTLGAGVQVGSHQFDLAARSLHYELEQFDIRDTGGSFYRESRSREWNREAWILSLRHHSPLPGGGSMYFDGALNFGERRIQDREESRGPSDSSLVEFAAGAGLENDHISLLLVDEPSAQEATVGLFARLWWGRNFAARSTFGDQRTEQRDFDHANLGVFARRPIVGGLRATAAVAVRRTLERVDVSIQYEDGSRWRLTSRDEDYSAAWAWGLEYSWQGLELAGVLRNDLQPGDPLLVLDVQLPLALGRD